MYLHSAVIPTRIWSSHCPSWATMVPLFSPDIYYTHILVAHGQLVINIFRAFRNFPSGSIPSVFWCMGVVPSHVQDFAFPLLQLDGGACWPNSPDYTDASQCQHNLLVYQPLLLALCHLKICCRCTLRTQGTWLVTDLQLSFMLLTTIL